MNTRRYRTNSAQETEQLAARLARILKPGSVVAFYGGMGAGKTAFTRGLAAGLGIRDGVSSPTFAIMQEYRGDGIQLHHFDLYRAPDAESLAAAGLYDSLESDAIVAIEWSEHLEEGELPAHAIRVSITTTDETGREITITGGPAL